MTVDQERVCSLYSDMAETVDEEGMIGGSMLLSVVTHSNRATL